MKSIKFCLLLAFLASPIVIFSSFRPETKPALQATLHPDLANDQLRVVATKPANKPLSLRFLEADGCPLHEEVIPGGTATVQVHLNLGGLPNGIYQVEISDQRRVQASVVQLSAHPTRKRQIKIWPLE